METFTDVLLVTANVGSLFDNVSAPNKVVNGSTLQRSRGIMFKAVWLTGKYAGAGAPEVSLAGLLAWPRLSYPGSKRANKRIKGDIYAVSMSAVSGMCSARAPLLLGLVPSTRTLRDPNKVEQGERVTINIWRHQRGCN